jgi:hypothetical protein
MAGALGMSTKEFHQQADVGLPPSSSSLDGYTFSKQLGVGLTVGGGAVQVVNAVDPIALESARFQPSNKKPDFNPRTFKCDTYPGFQNLLFKWVSNAWFQPLELTCDILVSKHAFKMGQIVPLHRGIGVQGVAENPRRATRGPRLAGRRRRLRLGIRRGGGEDHGQGEDPEHQRDVARGAGEPHHEGGQQGGAVQVESSSPTA